jgi:uncharacterized protein (DUF1015 family)
MSTLPPRMDAGLVLLPFRGTRFTANGAALARLLSPPYDVISSADRAALLGQDPDNVAALILPQTPDGQPDYEAASSRLRQELSNGVLATDPEPALYVYEMTTAPDAARQSTRTRGLLGAIQLRDPSDGVIFPHENTMSGPVADRLALMLATQANLEPIYLIYEGGGAASHAVMTTDSLPLVSEATTPDGITHRLWALREDSQLRDIGHDLASRTAVIADGHHRYATYLEVQRQLHALNGPGPWDVGLTLLVDVDAFGPQVEAIHRVVPNLSLETALSKLPQFTLDVFDARDPMELNTLGEAALRSDRFCIVITDGRRAAVVSKPQPALVDSVFAGNAHGLVESLDVAIVHRVIVEHCWGLPDDTEHLRYAHSAADAIADALNLDGIALLLRPTPVRDIIAVAQAGFRMPRKSTLFTPKPASGIVIRRFEDN